MIQSLRTNDCIDDIIEDYADMVYRLAASYTGSKVDADDVFQEVFIRLVKKKPKFVDEEHRKAWLLRVTINCSKKLIGSSWKRKTVEYDESINNSMIFEMQEDSELFYTIQKLPAKYRVVIHLFYYEDMSTKDIATTLNQFETTIRSQLSRARKKLKSLLEEE